MIKNVRENRLFQLYNSVTKSEAYFRHARWQGRRQCPRCNYRKIYHLRNKRFRCARCLFTFREFTKTYLERLKIPLNVVLYLIHLFILGVPAFRIVKELNISKKAIERFFRLIRKVIYIHSLIELKQLSGELEIDETMFGGRKPGKRGWGAEGKQIVFGIYQRNGKIIVFPVSSRSEDTLLPLIKRYTKKGSIYYTDEWHAYVSLVFRGKHIRITKEKGKSINEQNLNGLEGFWSYAKHWLYHYRGVPRRYFHYYLKEIEFRFNNRQEDLFDKIVRLLLTSEKPTKIIFLKQKSKISQPIYLSQRAKSCV